jgi:hypothetical protein
MRKTMKRWYQLVAFIHVHRSLNGAANILARTCNVSSSGFIVDFATECIQETLY